MIESSLPRRALGPISRVMAVAVFVLSVGGAAHAEWQPSGLLEIHYINIGQGGSTLIIGPNGKRILYDFGKVGGDRDIVPYLKKTLDLQPSQGLHITMVSHSSGSDTQPPLMS